MAVTMKVIVESGYVIQMGIVIVSVGEAIVAIPAHQNVKAV